MKTFLILFLLATLFLIGYYLIRNAKPSTVPVDKMTDTPAVYETAIFAGGCFWCMESFFQEVDGVKSVINGYTGGDETSPSYEDVSSGKTGHRESIQVSFDSNVLNYTQLLDIFWTHIDPTNAKGQFADNGFQYTTAIFYTTPAQEQLAIQSKQDLQDLKKFDKEIQSSILPAKKFYPAEEYHQDYYLKNALRFKVYSKGNGRRSYIKKTWGDVAEDVLEGKTCITNSCSVAKDLSSFKKLDKSELKNKLTALQYKVTQEEGTERPFKNEYWDNHKEGIYVDIVSGEPLFSSVDKFDSGTGWPSFLKPIEEGVVTEHDDYKLLAKRTEIRSRRADSHLGHIIMDGPEDNDHVRYCMNSASLKFIPKEDLNESGYAKYNFLFNK